MLKISFDLHFPSDKPTKSGKIFTQEAVKDLCDQMKDLPIKMFDLHGNSYRIGTITEGKISGDIVGCQGELYCAPRMVEKDGKAEYVSIGVMLKSPRVASRFEMLSNEPKFKVGDHVYILRRVNDSRVISSEKIRQVHAGKRTISYTLYGETIRRKQSDIFKTCEEAQRELKRGAAI